MNYHLGGQDIRSKLFDGKIHRAKLQEKQKSGRITSIECQNRLYRRMLVPRQWIIYLFMKMIIFLYKLTNV